MNKKTIVFIDANNWYHNIKGWFNEIRQKFQYLILKREDLVKCLKDYKVSLN